MKNTGLIFAFLLLVINPQASFSQDARLSYNLLPGNHYFLEIEMQQNTSSESLNSEEISMYSQMVLEFRVDSLSPAGHYHMSVRYARLLLSMLAMDMGIDINSKTGNNPILTELVDSLQGEWFRVIMSESGEILSTEGLPEIFGKLASYPQEDQQQLEVSLGTLHEAYGSDAFQSLFNLFVSIYPKVQPIRNWTRDLTYYFNTKPVHITNRYYLTKTTGEVVTIQGMGMINSLKKYSETVPLGEVTSTVSGTQTYDFHTDATSGWLKKCLSRQRLVIETTIVKSKQLPVGLKIPSYTETVFELKGFIQ
ncbi:MAG: hypothetical protein GY790_14945 [Bacteroidetes bacterium]|nr:hypothetical protein [Bacteroidota bacterium]